jgi:hypothetical protein
MAWLVDAIAVRRFAALDDTLLLTCTANGPGRHVKCLRLVLCRCYFPFYFFFDQHSGPLRRRRHRSRKRWAPFIFVLIPPFSIPQIRAASDRVECPTARRTFQDGDGALWTFGRHCGTNIMPAPIRVTMKSKREVNGRGLPPPRRTWSRLMVGLQGTPQQPKRTRWKVAAGECCANVDSDK